MGQIKQLSSASTIYLDTCIYIYFFENHPQFAQKSEAVFNLIRESNISITASPLLLTELLTLPLKKQNNSITQIYLKIDQNFPITWIDLNTSISKQAAQIRAKHNFRTPDAIHAATAITTNADYFVTSDKQFSKVKNLNTHLII